MSIGWLDTLKLTVPFVSAILLVWIKTEIEEFLARRTKRHAITRLTKEAIQSLATAIEALIRVADSSVRGKLRLVSFDVSTLIAECAADLSVLDPQKAYVYSDLASSTNLLIKGLDRLSDLILSRAKIPKGDSTEMLDRVINAQARITAADAISYGDSALKVMKEIPKSQRNADDQTMENLGKQIRDAEARLGQWPKVPDQTLATAFVDEF